MHVFSTTDVLGHDGDSLGVDGAQILGNLSHQTLEGKLADLKLSKFLVFSDLTESDSTRPLSVRLLDLVGFSGGLGGQLPAGSLSSGGFTCGLLGTSHC